MGGGGHSQHSLYGSIRARHLEKTAPLPAHSLTSAVGSPVALVSECPVEPARVLTACPVRRAGAACCVWVHRHDRTRRVLAPGDCCRPGKRCTDFMADYPGIGDRSVRELRYMLPTTVR